MKEMKKKYMTLICIATILMTLCACSKALDYIEESEQYNKFSSSLLFSATDSKISERITEEFTYEDVIDRYILASNGECCLINDWARLGEMGNNTFYNDFFLYDYANGEMQAFQCEEVLDNTMYQAAMNDEKIILFDVYARSFYVYDKDASLLTQSEKLSNEIGLNRLADIQCDANYIYLTLGDGETLCVLDYNLNLLFTETSESGWRLFPNHEKACLIAESTKDFYQYEKEEGLVEIDYKLTLPEDYNFEYDYIYPGDENYDFYVKFSYYVGEEDEKEEVCDLVGIKDGIGYKIFSTEQMGFSKDNLYTVISTDNASYIVGNYDSVDSVMKYYLLEECDTVMDYSVENGKETLQIAGLFIPEELKKTVNAFNLTSDAYYIELIEYSGTYEDVEDALNALYIDVATKQTIDGIILLELDKGDLVENDVLMDLNEYFTTGHVVSEEDFEPFVWENMKDEEGRITSVYPEFTVTGLLSAEDFSLDNLQYYKSLTGDGTFLFAETDSLGLFRELMKYSGNKFVNEEAKEVNFDEEFIAFLELLKAEEERKGSISVLDSPTAILEGEALALYEELAIPYSYTYFKYLFNSEFICTNYGVDAPVLVPGTSEIGIASYTDNKEGMYAFLDYMFTDEVYHWYFGKFRFPVLQSFWDDWMIRITATENYTDRFNEQILAGTFTYGYNDVVVNLGSMSEEEAAEMKAMIEGSVYIEPMDTEYLAIMEEEVQSYLYGDKTAEEVCKVLENRILTALKE